MCGKAGQLVPVSDGASHVMVRGAMMGGECGEIPS